MFGEKPSLFKAAKKPEKKSELQKAKKGEITNITIRKASNGFVVTHGMSTFDPGEPAPKDKVYADMKGLHQCLDEAFGGDKEEPKKEPPKKPEYPAPKKDKNGSVEETDED